jgi:hypothetical protein
VDRRLKASDVFNLSTPFLGKTSNFDEAFPGLADLVVTVRETDWDQSEVRLHQFRKGNIARFVDCSNARCYNGGFNLQSFISTKTYGKNKPADLETVAYCQGYEGSPKGRRNYGPCDHRFEVKVRVTYKSETSE